MRRIGRLVPPWLGGQLHRAPPSLTFGFTGPFNGQRMRVAAVRAMFDRVSFTAVVETGTFRALTTLFLRQITDAPIATIEINRRYYDYSRNRLRGKANVHQFNGDSPSELAKLATERRLDRWADVFYLDAHWLDNLPLVDELRAIRPAWPDFVALVDDFQVADDPGYGYDDYGPGKSLELGLLSDPDFADLHAFWPAAPAQQRDGPAPGYVVLATPGAMTDALLGLAELRSVGTLGEVLAARGSGARA